MKIRIKELERGTVVKIKNPGPGERGIWEVLGRVANSGLDDPAYDVQHVYNGRCRVFRRSRLIVRRNT